MATIGDTRLCCCPGTTKLPLSYQIGCMEEGKGGRTMFASSSFEVNVVAPDDAIFATDGRIGSGQQ